MAGELVNVVVKVGDSSNLVFNDLRVRAYRAITLKEFKELVDNIDTKLVIIEKIDDREYSFIKDYLMGLRGKDIGVYFYIRDNDELTSGLADELECDIFLDRRELYKAIYNNTCINIGTDITLKDMPTFSTGNDIDANNFEEVFDNPFLNKEDNLVDDASESSTHMINTQLIEQPVVEHNDENIEHQDIVVENNVVNVINDGDANVSYIEQIKKLEDIIVVLKDERDNYKNILDKLYNGVDFLEDPVSFEEYQKVVNELNNLKERLSSIESNSNYNESEINSLRAKLEEYMKKEEELNTANETIKLLNEEILKLKEAVSNAVSVTELENAKVVISDYEKEIEGLKLRLADYDDKVLKLEEALKLIDTLTTESNNLRNEISTLIEKISHYEIELSKYKDSVSTLENEKLARIKLYEILNNVIDDTYAKLNIIEELTEKVNNYEVKVNELNSELEQLRVKADDVDNVVAGVKAELDIELSKLRTENIELKGKVDVLNAQLVAKEYQYNELVKATGMDINGANTLIESNKALEVVNQSLREQIVLMKAELDTFKKSNKEMTQYIKTLEETNKNLKISLSAVSTGIAGAGRVNIPPCNYIGKAILIPVFGSGSFGITTTAMSLAYKLATDAKVLYIDFDLAMPKADGWFKINPIIKNIPEVDPNSNRSTGLGVFIDKGVQFFMNYAVSIINKVVQNKNGCLDYISGLYYKPESLKLISADYSTLLNFCGNNYSYIILDFGKLGYSDISDAIIRTISDVSFKNVFVTSSDKFEIRTFNIRLAENNIKKNNSVWVINMCKTTQMDANVKKLISPSELVMIPFEEDIFSEKIDFSKTKITKDRLNLITEALFNSN